jgi:tRNA-(ms[2]io[6]A)-hydroxylase
MQQSKNILHLKLPTDPRWADVAALSIEHILTDHAYCEQKAASSCISLIISYPHLPEITDTLTPIVTEEWAHFEAVIAELRKRGLPLGKQRKDEYVLELQKLMMKGGNEKERLIDKLLICALIEARSCERFKVLWENLRDKELSEFYYQFMVSEARHYTIFITLARNYGERAYVDARWQYFLEGEAKILQTMEFRADRMH